jgi:hypothetical protein
MEPAAPFPNFIQPCTAGVASDVYKTLSPLSTLPVTSSRIIMTNII